MIKCVELKHQHFLMVLLFGWRWLPMTRHRVRWPSLIHQGLKTLSSYLGLRYCLIGVIWVSVKCWFYDCNLVVRWQMRSLAKNRESPPDGFMCPGGWKVLVEYYESLAPASNGRVPQPLAAWCWLWCWSSLCIICYVSEFSSSIILYVWGDIVCYICNIMCYY